MLYCCPIQETDISQQSFLHKTEFCIDSALFLTYNINIFIVAFGGNMQNLELLKYGEYLAALISSAVRDTPAPKAFDNIRWKLLFELAQKHNVILMIYHKVITLDLPDDVRMLFKAEKNKILARSTRQNIEAERIFKVLEANSIKYIKLKGLHIRDYYPLSYMRSFSDIDIYVSSDDREKVKPVMTQLGYTLENSIGYHDEYIKDDFYIFEFHSSVVNHVMRYSPLFENPFSKAVPVSDSTFGYILDDEHLYLHLICHLYNHFIKTGCGVRLFADIMAFEERIKNVDFDFIESQLKKYNLSQFYTTVKKLNDYFFNGATPDNDTLYIASYILESETSGVYQNIVANYTTKDKFRRVREDFFPSAKVLSQRYPVLKKAPVLLPLCWIRRGFYTLFFRRNILKSEINTIKSFNSKEYKEIGRIRKLADNSKE